MKRLLFFLAILVLILPGSPGESQAPGSSSAKKKAWYQPRKDLKKASPSSGECGSGKGQTPCPGSESGKGSSPGREERIEEIVAEHERYWDNCRSTGGTVASGRCDCGVRTLQTDGSCFFRRVRGLKILTQTAAFSESESGAKFIFNVCPTVPYMRSGSSWTNLWNSSDCFMAKIDASGDRFSRGGFETIDFSLHPEMMLPSGKMISELLYPDDFQYFGFYPDLDAFDGGLGALGTSIGEGTGFDAHLLAGLEVQVQLVSGGSFDYVTIYRNPVVNRWVEIPGSILPSEPGHQFSPHSPSDVSYAFYIETGSLDDAGSDATFSIRLQQDMDAIMTDQLDYWLDSYAMDDAPLLQRRVSGSIDIDLNWGGDGGYNDFQRNGKTSYGVTIPFASALASGFKVVNRGGEDAWFLHRIRAYAFKPTDIIAGQACRFVEVTPDVWMSSNPDEAVSVWPPSGYQAFPTTDMTCPSLNTIQWGNGESGAYAFGRY